MNFKDAEIEAFVKFISELTGKNFILDEKVRGQDHGDQPGRTDARRGVRGLPGDPRGEGLHASCPPARCSKSSPSRRQADEHRDDQGPAHPWRSGVTRIVPLKFWTPRRGQDSRPAPLEIRPPSSPTLPPTCSSSPTRTRTSSGCRTSWTPSTWSPRAPTLEIIRLKYASAETIAKLLLQASGRRGSGARHPSGPRAAAPQGTPGPPIPAAARGRGGDARSKIIPDRPHELPDRPRGPRTLQRSSP